MTGGVKGRERGGKGWGGEGLYTTNRGYNPVHRKKHSKAGAERKVSSVGGGDSQRKVIFRPGHEGEKSEGKNTV